MSEITANERFEADIERVANSVAASRQRFAESLQSVNTKQSKCWYDYGYPTTLTFDKLYTAYKRSGYGKAGVEVIADKCWQSNPWLETSNKNWLSKFEAFAKRVNLWHNLKLLDYRQRTGEYGALLLTVSDGKKLETELESISNLDLIESVTPYYQSQMEPIDYYQNTSDPKYGLPITYQLRENVLGDRNEGTNEPRVVHESRVIIWAEGATGNSIFGNSVLEAGFNALINIEKIQGAGGEGFWKNARTAMKLNADAGKDIQQLASMYKVPVEKVASKLNEKLKDFNTNLDASLMLGGINAETISVNLPNPKEFLEGNKLEFASSVKVPMTILEGNQSGNQASQENGSTLDEQCESRRANEVNNFILRKFVGRLVDLKALPEQKDLEVMWDSLIEPSPSEKLEAAMKMVDANQKAMGTGKVYFTVEEVRERAGYNSKINQEADERDVQAEE